MKGMYFGILGFAGSRIAEPNTKDHGDLYWTNPFTSDGRVVEQFGSRLPNIKNGLILDIGCSVGMTTRELSQIYPDSTVIGMDINHLAVGAARDAGRSERLVVADAYLPPFKDGIFDAIFCMNNVALILDNLRYRGVDKLYLGRIEKLAKPDGHLLFSARERTFVSRRNRLTGHLSVHLKDLG